MWQIDQVTLRLFIAVCEEGTIARAAEREFIAPSAVSKRLADLEALVDVALLSRSQRGVRATAAGRRCCGMHGSSCAAMNACRPS